MTPRFGTDGIRGVANSELSPELVLRLGRAAAHVLGRGAEEARPTFLIGRDTRASSELLAQALAAGLASCGVDVVELGVVPTAAAALLCRDLGAAAGAIVSASHNPAADNGVKFFARGGTKLTAADEEEIERLLEAEEGRNPEDAGGLPRPIGGDVGRITMRPELAERYAEILLATVDTGLDGLRVVVDAANGAASVLGPEVLRRLGAQVEVRFAEPDGTNINEGCGATSPAALAAAVVESGADLGIAFDGDADRLIAVDHTGRVVDGDHILAVCAIDLHARGDLRGDAVVATVMSNVGLEVLLRENGIGVLECPVGDRNVLLALEEHDLVLGGEQSGHVIFRHLSPTGCGLLTALQLLQVVRSSGASLADLAGAMKSYPQVAVAIPLDDRARLDSATAFWDVVAATEADLGDSGRVVVRPSGTEPVLRVMVQAPSETAAGEAVERITSAASVI
ncbi:MAG: phosphoglucosamine mutase [Acidimicrobiia bacterium]|nr:phosphoglucosamine mutase [Acidimicrobiia bacterium]